MKSPGPVGGDEPFVRSVGIDVVVRRNEKVSIVDDRDVYLIGHAPACACWSELFDHAGPVRLIHSGDADEYASGLANHHGKTQTRHT